MNFDLFQIHPSVHLVSVQINSAHEGEVFLYPEEKSQINTLNTEKRKLEFLAARQLRNKLQIQSPIIYNENGKPHLLPSLQNFISISHSSNVVVLGKSEFEIGIDLEVIQERTVKIIDKYAVDREKSMLMHSNWTLQEWYTMIWCAKEAVYKLCGIKGLAFKVEISLDHISNFNETHLTIQASIKREGFEKNKIELLGCKDEKFAFALAYFKDELSSSYLVP